MSIANLLVPNNYHLYIDSPVLQGSLIPDTDNTYDLGSNILRWRDTNTYDLSIKNSRLFVNSGPNTRQIDIVSPAPNDTMTTNAGIQTVTNKTLSSTVSLQFTGAGESALSTYRTGTFNLTIEGIWAASQVIAIGYVKVGKNITLNIPTVQVAQTTAASINNNAASLIPTELRIATTTSFMIRVRDVSFQNSPGLLILYDDGSFEINKTLSASTAFTGAGTGGFAQTAVSYLNA